MLLEYEALIRATCFFVVFMAIALWEFAGPRRADNPQRSLRWFSNLVLVVINSALLRLLLPIMAVGIAQLAADKSWGLLNQIDLPIALDLLLGIVLLDMAIYWQHRVFHRIPLLWCLHRLHHSDIVYDVTTGLRFHPIEILLSMLIKMAVVIVLGTTAAAVIVFEVLLNATAMFNHGNIRLPQAVDKKLRWFIVTPDMHRVHHSVYREEHDSNYGFNLPWWDRLFGSYCDQPREGHLAMRIGLHYFRDNKQQQLRALLMQPFRS